MGLGKITKATYVSVRDGRLITKDSDGEEAEHDYLEGRLTAVNTQVKDFAGKTVSQLLLEFTDEDGENFILSTGEHSGVARSILNALASIEEFSGEIRITTYFKGGYTKVAVSQNGKRVSWKHKTLPPADTREDFFRKIIEELAEKVATAEVVSSNAGNGNKQCLPSKQDIING